MIHPGPCSPTSGPHQPQLPPTPDESGKRRGPVSKGAGYSGGCAGLLSSVKILGEGVDTAHCGAVAFCDARGSMVDIVQMVGRALGMKLGVGKIGSLVVPLFLGPDEEADDMLTSN